MKNFSIASIIFSIMIFSGCGTTEENNTTASACGDNLNMLSGDNPIITLEGDTEIEIPLGTENVLADDRFCVYDPQDGVLTEASVTRESNIDFSRTGVYQVNYTVTDSDGNTDTASRTVTIVDANNGSSTANTDDGSSTNSDIYNSDPFGNNSSTDNTNQVATVDLGQEVGTNTNSSSTSSGGSELDSFKTWYYNTCGQTFNESLYTQSTGAYNGKISCSNMGLTEIYLTPLNIFSSIDTIDLSHNNLTDIDFTPIQNIQGLNYLYINNNTATLKKKYDTVSERNALFRLFTNLHGGDGKTGLFIGFKPHQQESDKENLIVHF